MKKKKKIDKPLNADNFFFKREQLSNPNVDTSFSYSMMENLHTISYDIKAL